MEEEVSSRCERIINQTISLENCGCISKEYALEVISLVGCLPSYILERNKFAKEARKIE